MNNLIKRSLSGIVYIAVIIGALTAGANWLAVLCMVLGLTAINELMNLCCDAPTSSVGVVSRVTALLTVCLGLFLMCGVPFLDTASLDLRTTMLILWVLMGVLGLALVMRLVLTVFDTGAHALRDCAFTMFGYLYICLPLVALNALGSVMPGTGYDWSLPLALFVMIWLNDTGAYCVGSLIGKRRLCERLSPKKSWEGFWGGLVFAMLGGLVFALICAPDRLIYWTLSGALVSVAATIGDLFESLIKRTVGVKDSGKLIPGHGGILDRIDSLLLAAPVLLLYTLFY